MVRRSNNLPLLPTSYFFLEIANRRKAYEAAHPDSHVISLGVGDTTEPLDEDIVRGCCRKAELLGTNEGYTGYPAAFGTDELRDLIAENVYNNVVSKDDVIISDGSKPDIARLQYLFDLDTPVAVQNPTYPVYVDDTVICGRAGSTQDSGVTYSNIQYLPCTVENDFFPDLSVIKPGSLVYFCSPNNPTGVTATFEQLEKLVKFAKDTKSIILFDSAYRQLEYITDPALPKSIYEVEGAKEVALEVSSFSKVFGFTGVRLGWTVCPKELKFDDGSSVRTDWCRLMSTMFNGASNIAEAAGVEAMRCYKKQVAKAVGYYMRNAHTLRETLLSCKLKVYGGLNSPYLWLKVPEKSSWEAFEFFLNEMAIIVTPGVGFGEHGKGFIRISCFGHEENVAIACQRIKAAFNAA